MSHELRPESRPIAEILASSLNGERVDVLIGGDTHVERLEFRDEVLLINPGSPSLPHHLSTRLGALGLLTVAPHRLESEIIALGPSAGARNPTRPQHVVIERGAVIEASLDGSAIAPAEFLKAPHERVAANGA